MDRKLKVVWICQFSDEKTRRNLIFSPFYYRRVLSYFSKMRLLSDSDNAVWVTNAICEFESLKDIDLTVLFPHSGIKGKSQNFDIKGIHYVCFKGEQDNFLSYITKDLAFNKYSLFKKNRLFISHTIQRLKPDIVHVIGAENPNYSLAALDVPNDIPCIVTLQTLMSVPDFCDNYNIEKKQYEYRANIEASVIKRCNYVTSDVGVFKTNVEKYIKPNVTFLKLGLALGVDIDTSYDKKVYDFVYFAGDIRKAGDDAIEAFYLASKKRPEITLNLSGAYSNDYKHYLDAKLRELGLENRVFITGAKKSRKEVLQQIKKAKCALIPLRVDYISSTIREAMACGLPVVTTITDGTPILNSKRDSVLLSKIDDYEAMANNMLLLHENEEYAIQIRNNAIETVRELYSNESIMRQWHQAYYSIVDNFRNNVPFPRELTY